VNKTDSLLIDLDGVIYEGDTPISGAAEAMAWLQEHDVPRLFLTNTSSRPRSALVEKLAGMGIHTEESWILTPPLAASRWLVANTSGPVALFVSEDTVEEFAQLDVAAPSDSGSVAAVVIGDMSDRWSYAELNRAFRLLMGDPPPVLVALGMTRYWHAPDGLRLDTAPFVTALQHATAIEPVVLGKPARPFFEMALAELGARAAQTWMIGDDIRTDIDGAQQVGIRATLLKTGKYRPADLEQGIEPDWVLDSVADLPAWWIDAAGARAR
jgi:HAD superfamily hydrolase (TIGR01458 family)